MSSIVVGMCFGMPHWTETVLYFPRAYFVFIGHVENIKGNAIPNIDSLKPTKIKL